VYNVISRLINEHDIRILNAKEPKIIQVSSLETDETTHQIMSFKGSSSSQEMFHFKHEGSFLIKLHQT
jgi:hypothetical protein